MADIFVSYTSTDRDWAFWIGHELEDLGHSPHIHEWEVPGGANVMAWMEAQTDAAAHVLCVVSEKYLKAPYSSLERGAGQWAAVTRRPNFALPVFVEPCEVPILFAPLKRCDLHGMTENEARARLKAFLEPARKPPRGPFPGGARSPPASTATAPRPIFPGKIAHSNVPIRVPEHFLGRHKLPMNKERRPRPRQNNLWFRYNESESVLVFLHGVLSDSRSCWLYENKQNPAINCYWPELIQSDPRFCDISIYLAGYVTDPDSGAYEIRDCANEVLGALKRKEIDGHPSVMEKANIIFVCHSMGGIVARYLLEANHHEFKNKRVGLVLIASPSYGSEWANSLDALLWYFNNKQGIRLRWGGWNLKDLDDRFKDLKDKALIPNLSGIELYENRFIAYWKWLPIFSGKLVVTKESAGRYFGAPRQIPSSDHFSICKPQDNRSHVHQYLYDFLFDKNLLPSEAVPSSDLRSMGTPSPPPLIGLQSSGRGQIVARDNVGAGSGDGHLHSGEDHSRFQTARRKAEVLCNDGKPEEAAQVFVAALACEEQLERDRQEDHKKRRSRYRDEALITAQKVDCPAAVIGIARQIAEIVHPTEPDAQRAYLRNCASDYNTIAETQGERWALLNAYEIFKWIADNS